MNTPQAPRTLKIEMVNTTEQEQRSGIDLQKVVDSGLSVIPGTILPEPPPPRTRLQIATELDNAEKEAAANRSLVALDDAKIKRLTAELRNYGRKPREKNGTP